MRHPPFLAGLAWLGPWQLQYSTTDDKKIPLRLVNAVGFFVCLFYFKYCSKAMK